MKRRSFELVDRLYCQYILQELKELHSIILYLYTAVHQVHSNPSSWGFITMNEIRPLIGGMASSTVNGKNAAINQFNAIFSLHQDFFSSSRFSSIQNNGFACVGLCGEFFLCLRGRRKSKFWSREKKTKIRLRLDRVYILHRHSLSVFVRTERTRKRESCRTPLFAPSSFLLPSSIFDLPPQTPDPRPEIKIVFWKKEKRPVFPFWDRIVLLFSIFKNPELARVERNGLT